ncbi:DUF6381 family protein [Streptomyces sp. NPDC059176]|uniref:DUF6381 family protein n=1 Tax=unclassified Streptomyces TaxID=2593676 RepID=UPI0036855EA4
MGANGESADQAARKFQKAQELETAADHETDPEERRRLLDQARKLMEQSTRRQGGEDRGPE